MKDFQEIGGGYSFQSLRVGMIVRAPSGKQIYIQPGDDESAMRETIAALDEISENITDAKRGTIADMALGEYFTTYIEAREAADVMGLSVRRATIDVGCSYTLIDREPQEFSRGSHLIEDAEDFVDDPSDGWEW